MAIVITKQPTSVAANVKDTVSITLEATGDGLVYDWQYSSNGTKFYSLSASASASNWTYDQPTLTFRGYSDHLKYYFRCKITDFNGDSVFSNIVRAINLAEAGAGFILPETLHSLAEAIRAKTETTDKILPADMVAMINALGASGELIAGTSTPASITTELNLGVSLPISENYIFVARYNGSTNNTYKYFVIVYIVCINGEKAGGSMYIGQRVSYYTSASDMTLSETKLACAGSQTNEKFYTGTYDWWYVNA